MIPGCQPELSVVIPTFNEAEALPALLGNLNLQRGLSFEVIVADGGSQDETLQRAQKLAATLSYPLRVVKAAKGRARQLNAGAANAQGSFLLFLHADCRFDEEQALTNALAALRAEITRRGHGRIAGHFELRFDRQKDLHSAAYYFYEAKAALDRRGCTHGDQGFLLSRTFWESAGPFDASLPILEDTSFAETVRRQGLWVLLPNRLWTSARRFEAEGMRARQTLNALVMNFAAIGWGDFFSEARQIYRQQDKTDALRLLPFLLLIRRLLRKTGMKERCRLWYRTGCYVRTNAWQLAFFLDVQRARRCQCPPSQVQGTLLKRFEMLFEPITDNVLGRSIATILVWSWFQLTCIGSLLSERH